MTTAVNDTAIQQAAAALDEHVRQIIAWHFSPETGCDHWLEFAAAADFDPLTDVQGFDDLLRLFDHFDADHVLRFEPQEKMAPKAFRGRPYNIFETGGTTGMPKQRIGWDDYKTDYEAFSATLDDAAFPPGDNWLMIGPTGPRRLRLAIEHLANFRGSSCYFIDLDPRWVKKLIADKQFAQAKAYMQHVIDQALPILKHRKVSALFTTPRLLESLAERVSIPNAGIKGCFVGGTTMTPQYVRFLIEEVLEGQTKLVPTYGNTLMGLAAHKQLTPEDNYSITYYAPQPRAVLRIVDPDATQNTVDYDEFGRVELTTLTKEFFMPRFLERDEAIRRRPTVERPWDGVGDVRPFGASTQTIVEGVY
ncbi:long-chain fatty acid--CoA ligase [Planctomycetales bacterium ZRK34]|nr:long-chain fatty acid--CoA ligase [Planctomycetales bacterium ZRK34]